jgi:alginate O-acetyltransferase complex protein AlgI
MTFTSLTFFLFLALVFSAYWALRSRRLQNILLVIASFCFYGWWDYRFAGLLFGASIIDYGIAIGLSRTDQPGPRRWLLASGITVNLSLLSFFKYFNFFADSAVTLLNTLGFHADPVTLNVVLPVGISFYTFQSMGYSIDVYRRQLPAERHLIDYMAYVSFFPQLVAGPIERAGRFLPQFQMTRVFDPVSATDGCRQILWGFFKKIVVADNLAVLVERAYATPSAVSGGAALLGTFCFALQIYADFSAYSDIAIGTARLFGFRLCRNFAFPYFSLTPVEFWRRWHISLSTWFRDYLFVPLGGSRNGRRTLLRNIMITFLISGLWHGASWNYVIWGGLNGLAICAFAIAGLNIRTKPEDLPGGQGWLPSPKALLGMLGTFLFISFTWVFFRAVTLTDACHVLQHIGRDLVQGTLLQGTKHLLIESRDSLTLLFAGLMLSTEWLTRQHPHPLYFGRLPRWVRWTVYTMLLWFTWRFGAFSSNSSFIYFQF